MSSYSNQIQVEVASRTFEGSPVRPNDDANALGFSACDAVHVHHCVISASALSEALKFSKCRQVLVEHCRIVGGYEDCLDIVRGCRYTFRECEFVAGKDTQYHATIKGGVDEVHFDHCRFAGKVSAHSVDLGNWTDYDIVDRPETRNVFFYNCVWDRPSTIRTIHASRPTLVFCDNARLVKWPKILVRGFWFVRRIWQRLFEKRPAESELVVQPWER